MEVKKCCYLCKNLNSELIFGYECKGNFDLEIEDCFECYCNEIEFELIDELIK